MSTDTWQRVILGNHADIRARIGWRGLSSTEYTKEGPYLIAGNHIANGLIEWTACDHIPEWRILKPDPAQHAPEGGTVQYPRQHVGG